MLYCSPLPTSANFVSFVSKEGGTSFRCRAGCGRWLLGVFTLVKMSPVVVVAVYRKPTLLFSLKPEKYTSHPNIPPKVSHPVV